MIAQERLKELLNYNPDTGEFHWKIATSNVIKVGARAGCVRADGYLTIRADNKPELSHRLAFVYMTGTCPKVIDHIDGDVANNKWCNLREATFVTNQYNSKIRKDNKTGVKGVYTRGDKFGARIRHNGKVIYVGSFQTIAEAEVNLKRVRESLHKEFTNHGN